MTFGYQKKFCQIGQHDGHDCGSVAVGRLQNGWDLWVCLHHAEVAAANGFDVKMIFDTLREVHRNGDGQ